MLLTLQKRKNTIRRHRPLPCRRRELCEVIAFVRVVSRCKEPGSGCVLIGSHRDEAFGVQLRPQTCCEPYGWNGPNFNEDAVNSNGIRSFPWGIELHAFDLCVSKDFQYVALENEPDIRSRFHPIHPVGLRAKCIPAMNEVHGLGQ